MHGPMAVVLWAVMLLSACSQLPIGQSAAEPEKDTPDPSELVLTPAELPRSLSLDEENSGYNDELSGSVWSADYLRSFKQNGGIRGYTTNYTRSGFSVSAFSVLALRSTVWIYRTAKQAKEHFDLLGRNLAKGWSLASVEPMGDQTFAAVSEQISKDGQGRVLIQVRVRKGQYVADVTTASVRGVLIGQEVLPLARQAVAKLP